MKLEKGVISSPQLIALIGIFIQGSVFCTLFVFAISPKDIWFVSLVSFVIFSFFALAYIGLMQKFPGKNIIQVNDIIYGPYLGKAVSSLYILFLFLLTIANVVFFVNFIAGIFMPETPIIALAVMIVFVCGWAVRNGIEALARLSPIFLAIVSISILLALVLVSYKIDFNNFLPFLDIPLTDFIQINHIFLAIFYGELFIFILFFIPYMNKIPKAKKSVILGLVIGGTSIFIISVMITGVLGNLSTIMNAPLISTMRQAEIGKALTRLEFIIVSILMFSVFMKISVIYYGTALSISQALNLRSYKPLVVPVGIIFIALVVPMFDNPIAQAECGMKTWPFFAAIFEFLLPAITLLIARIRRLPEIKGGEC